MKMASRLKNLAPDLWTMSFPLKFLGADLQRNVTILRLSSGKLLIHSTAPFEPDDIDTILNLGHASWIMDALIRHDTFAQQGSDSFPGARYLVPEGFESDGIATRKIFPPPPEWRGEIGVIPVIGAPSFGEVVILHRASKTLVVGDLLFNFGRRHPWWTRFLAKLGSVGGNASPGVSRPFKKAIVDDTAFLDSLREILLLDFDRIIVGHGDPIEKGGKEALRSAYRAAGFPSL